MAAFTSKAAGNWSSAGQTTWNEVGVPGDGDTVTISHNITVDTDTTVGSSPNTGGTAAIAFSSSVGGKSLTIAAGVTLRVRGPLQLDSNSDTIGQGPYINVSAGASFILDPASGQQYTINGNRFYYIVCNGTSGSHCIFKTDTARGGLPGYFGYAAFRGGGLVTATYTDFENWGDTTHFGVGSKMYTTTDTALWNVTVTNCNFTATSYSHVPANNATWTGYLTFNDNIFASTPLQTYAGITNVGYTFEWSNTSSVANQSVQRNYFPYKSYWIIKGTAFTIASNYLVGWGMHSASTWTLGQFVGNLLIINTNAEGTLLGPPQNCYILGSTAVSNQHFLAAPAGTYTMDGLIFDAPDTLQTTDEGDCVLSGTNLTVKNCIVLPIANGAYAGKAVGTMWTAQTAATTATFEHNTFVAQNGIVVGEAFNSQAGAISSIKSNIAWTDTAAFGHLFVDSSAIKATDVVSPVNLDYNGLLNPAAASGTNSIAGVAANFSSTPDSHNVTGDPQFVEKTRNIQTWGSTLHGTDGTTAAALAVLAANPALIYDTTNPSALWQWVRAGFAPQNAAYKDAGHDGVTIGAVEWVPSVPPKMQYYRRMRAA